MVHFILEKKVISLKLQGGLASRALSLGSSRNSYCTPKIRTPLMSTPVNGRTLLPSTLESSCLLVMLVTSQSPINKTVNSVLVPRGMLQKEQASAFVLPSHTW